MFYYLQTIPGLGPLAWEEAETHLTQSGDNQGLRAAGIRIVPRRDDMVMLNYSGNARALLRLRVSEDVFVVAFRAFKIAPDERGLRQMHAATREARGIGEALAVWKHVNRTQRNPSTFRVVVREVGAHRFRRRDIGRAVADAIKAGWTGRWREVDENADIEIWATLLDNELLCGFRLSDASMRQRDKGQHKPAALRPALAAAMIRLTEPEPNDIFLDPMAGTGTLLLERAAAGPFQQIYGADSSAAAVKTLRASSRSIVGPVQCERWDVRALPLADQSVDAIAVNMPFGKKIEAGLDFPLLYREALTEMQRVLRTGGRLVALVGEPKMLDAARGAVARQLRPAGRHRLMVLGMAAAICVFERQ